MAKAAKKRPFPQQTRRAPKRWLLPAVAAVVLVLVGLGLAVGLWRGGSSSGDAATGLPATPDYHSLIVAAADADVLTLGTHEGLFESRDGGSTWENTALSGEDAMNLGRAEQGALLTAGHNVYARSTDGGETWRPLEPDGLPHLDIHGFAIDPSNRRTMYVALAGEGLYRSDDGGQGYRLVSREVGPAVMALAVTPAGRLLAGDLEKGLMVSDDGGRSWKQTLAAGVLGLAVNPDEPEHILAAGQPGVLLSRDGGKSWDEVMRLAEGAGPVAWAPAAPAVAYAVGFDRLLYRSEDGGESWQPVERGA